MSITKDIGLPLTPFTLELIFRVWLLDGKKWWEYPDMGTILLTFGFWSLFMLAKTPDAHLLPTDSEVNSAYEKIKNNFILTVVAGFTLFGMNVIAKLLLEILPNQKDIISGRVLLAISIVTICYSIYCLINIFVNRDPIRRMFAG